jgi:type II secretory pathway pseudopilin PulG
VSAVEWPQGGISRRRTHKGDDPAHRCSSPAPRPGGRPDAGLTLIELMVALMVAFVALTVLAGVFIGALHTLTVAKQRQTATALGTRAMEQMRALPFSTITSGLSINDLAGDANITSPARQHAHAEPAAAPTVIEVLQTNGDAMTTAPPPPCEGLRTPLLPHRCTARLDRVVYTVASYVSVVAGGGPTQYSLTTIVTWKSSATRGRDKTVVNRSRAFSPNGTCTPANHPFNTPCQSQYSAYAGLSEGGVTLSGSRPAHRSLPASTSSRPSCRCRASRPPRCGADGHGQRGDRRAQREDRAGRGYS